MLAACRPGAKVETLNLVTTTTTQDSGLLDRLVPAAEKALHVHVRAIAVGSGEALRYAERGEADVLLAHSPAAEEQVVAAGHLVDRSPLMWNRFFIVGPPADPAHLAGVADPVEAFRRLRAAGAPFASRGDESGTHRKEQELWKAAGLPPSAPHVLSTGQGQGETLLVAAEKGAYALCDSSTWAKLHPARLAVLVDPAGNGGGTALANPYHVMRANEARHPTNAAAAKRFLEWVHGREAEAILRQSGFLPGAPPAS